MRWLPAILAFLVAATPAGAADTGTSLDILHGIGVISDSNSDEYRADDNRGGDYAATTLNWVEQLVRYRGVILRHRRR